MGSILFPITVTPLEIWFTLSLNTFQGSKADFDDADTSIHHVCPLI